MILNIVVSIISWWFKYFWLCYYSRNKTLELKITSTFVYNIVIGKKNELKSQNICLWTLINTSPENDLFDTSRWKLLLKNDSWPIATRSIWQAQTLPNSKMQNNEYISKLKRWCPEDMATRIRMPITWTVVDSGCSTCSWWWRPTLSSSQSQ